MESRTKHRILGILVIIGLVIILFPFFERQAEQKSDVALVSSPPFPDQAVTLDSSDLQQPISQQTVTQETSIPITEAAPHPDDNAPPAEMSTSSSATPTNAVPVAELEPVSTPIQTVATDDRKQPKAPDFQHRSSNKQKPAKLLAKPHLNQTVQTNRVSLAKIKKSVAVVDQLSKLKQAAWVIQIGSYQNKANALRLVNQLRSNGYTAFIQDVSSDEGRNTRVYVGPESKRKSALSLADQINKEMNLHGIVISYQPLAL